MSRAKVDDIVWAVPKRRIDTIALKIKDVQDGKFNCLSLYLNEFLWDKGHIAQICDLIKKGNLQDLEIYHPIIDRVIARLVSVIKKYGSEVKVKIRCIQSSYGNNLDLEKILKDCPNVECTLIKYDKNPNAPSTKIINCCKQPLQFSASGEDSDTDYTLDEDVPCATAPAAAVVIAGEQAPKYNISNLDPEL